MNKLMEAEKKIENSVVTGYKAIENSVVSGYKKIEDKFVETYLPQYDAKSKNSDSAEQGGSSAKATAKTSSVVENGLLAGLDAIENSVSVGFKAIKGAVAAGTGIAN